MRETSVQMTRALRLVLRSSPAATAGLFVMTLLRAATPPTAAYVGKLIVDAVLAAQAATGDARATAISYAVRLVAVEFGVLALDALAVQALSMIRTLIGARLGVDINVQILTKALTLELPHFEDPETYDKLQRARREASQRPLNLIINTFSIVRNALTLAGYAVLVFTFSPLAVLGLMAASLPAFAAQAKFSQQVFRQMHRRTPESRQLGYLEHLLSNDKYVKEVKLFRLGPLLLDRYRALAVRFFDEDRRLAIRRSSWTFVFSLVSSVAFYGCYAAVIVAAVEGRITLGQMTLYVVAFRQGQENFSALLGAVGSLYEDALYLSNLSTFMGIDPAAGLPAPTGVTPRDEQGLRMEGVGFRYPGSDKWALRGVNLFVPKGQSLALVGENGAGKTTFIKLLTRLYRPTEGRIFLDGRDLSDWDEATLRQRIGVIFQDFAQYQFRVRDNVGFGSVAHVDDDARLSRAVEGGGAAAFVSALSQGLDTQLGRWFHDGAELSGGQWQKIALARSFMREEADVLILDEPTAALDAAAEHAIFERFRALAAGRTTILISHRFSTVRMADRILVVEGGHVIEDGSHDELVARGGRYAHLFTLQAQGYR